MDDARAVMVYDANKKSLVVAYLLWWFLGWFGGHRFYMGLTGSAIAMLAITCISVVLSVVLIGYFGLFVMGIWWLIDAILLPGMVRRFNLELAARITG